MTFNPTPAYVAGICKNHGILAHCIGGANDHIHLLIQLPQILPLAKAVLTIKSNSSRWAHAQNHKFAWQEGYAAFSVASQLPAVLRYIQNQSTHHKKMPFDAEFLALLKKHNIPFDPNFALAGPAPMSHPRRSKSPTRRFPLPTPNQRRRRG